MISTRSFLVLLAICAGSAFGAPLAYTVVDNSSSLLMNQASSDALWREHASARLMRLYPVKKWGFVSEVEGGFDDAKNCVITARAMMLPRTGKTLVYRPAKTATAFGIQPGASQQQCRAFATTKLREAIGAVSSALLAE
jgi:hypothetical protein